MLRIYYYSIFYLFISKSNSIFYLESFYRLLCYVMLCYSYACLLFRAILFLYLSLRLWCLVLAPPAILDALGEGIGGGVLRAFCCACNRCCVPV